MILGQPVQEHTGLEAPRRYGQRPGLSGAYCGL